MMSMAEFQVTPVRSHVTSATSKSRAPRSNAFSGSASTQMKICANAPHIDGRWGVYSVIVALA